MKTRSSSMAPIDAPPESQQAHRTVDISAKIVHLARSAIRTVPYFEHIESEATGQTK